MNTLSNSSEPDARACEGGIPLCEPNISGHEWRYVQECLDSGWVSSVGAFVDRFEQQFADSLGVKYAVATVNGTSALHVALLVSGVAMDDEVLVPALTFIAPANAIRYVGAWPVFIDVDADYGQMDSDRVSAFLRRECDVSTRGVVNRRTRRRVSAILPVDILGHPCDLDPILEIAREFGLAVVEDATESLGARYKNRLLGRNSPMTAFSFNGNKLLTTGGGGMLVTDDPDMASRARYLSTQAKDDPCEFVHGAIGYNYRLTNVQAAIGCAQLERLDEFVEAKRRIAQRYDAEFAGLDGIAPIREAPWAFSACWLYTVRVDAERFGIDSRALLHNLAANGIQSRPLWQPLHLSPAHRGSASTNCPEAEAWYHQALSLPCSTGLTEKQQTRVVDAVRRAQAVGRDVGV